MQLRARVRQVPVIGPSVSRVLRWRRDRSFSGSADHWERHYEAGGTSGPGSYGEHAAFKAEVLAAFVADHDVRSVIELGCGDGNQLSLTPYPSYVGLDISRSALPRCITRFDGDPTKSFFLYDPRCFVDRTGLLRAEAALSLDVIFHLVEDAVFDAYLNHLFSAATRFVVVYSSNTDEQLSNTPEVRHRHFTRWVEQHQSHWKLVDVRRNPLPWDPVTRLGSPADFYFFAREAQLPSPRRDGPQVMP